MLKPMSRERRRVVLFAAGCGLLCTLPTMVLLPLRQSHRLGDAPYFMGVGICLGLAIACLTVAIVGVRKGKDVG